MASCTFSDAGARGGRLWQTVYQYLRRWKHDGTWERIREALRPQVRLAEVKAWAPSTAIIDSQSVKTTGKEASWL